MEEPSSYLKHADEAWIARTHELMGLVPLNPVWSKAEILIGLSAVACGVKLLSMAGLLALAGGTLLALGGYLALAGNRSHYYQSQNRQTAFLLQTLIGNAGVVRDSE